jgi:hypothetical protein
VAVRVLRGKAARPASVRRVLPDVGGRSGRIVVMMTEQTEAEGSEQRLAEWRQRDHPTVTALAGFVTGMLFVTLVPGGFVGFLRLMFEYDTAENLFPLVLLSLAVPIALLVASRTRRFGIYMVVGMVITALVVLGVASLVLYYLVQHDV